MDFRQESHRTVLRQVSRPVRIAHFSPGEYSLGTIMLSPLIPFKSTMVKQLNARGFNTSQLTFKNLVALYYNEFVSNKENTSSSFERISTYDFRNNIAFKLKPSDNFEKDYNNSRYFDNIDNVVNNITSQFRWARNRRKEALRNNLDPATVLTDDELVQAKAAERIATQLENKSLDNRAFKIADVKSFLYIALGVWLFYYMFK